MPPTLSLLTLGLALAQPPAPTIFVLGLESSTQPSDEVDVVVDLLTAALAERPGLDVLSGADVTDMLQLEAQRAAVGCEERSCLAQLAGAVGADLVVAGDVNRVGTILHINTSLIETEGATVVGRAQAEAHSIPALAEKMRDLAHNLLAERSGLEPKVIAPAFEGRSVGSLGGLATGVLVGASGASTTCGLLTVGSLPCLLIGMSDLFALPILLALLGTPCAAAGVSYGASLLADRLAGADPSHLRAVLSATSTGAVAVVTSLLAIPITWGLLIWVPLLMGGQLSEDPKLVVGGFVTGLVAAAVVGGLVSLIAVFVTSLIGIGLFDDEPAVVEQADPERWVERRQLIQTAQWY